MTQTDLEESIVRKLSVQCVMEASVNTQRYRLGLSWQAWVVLLFGLVLTGLLLIPRQSATRIAQKPIERFEIFDRVPGRNPQVTLEERAEFSEPDWRTTRIVHFEKLDEGGTHRFRLARSQEWIAENAVAVGSQVEIDLPEQGLTGASRVVAITLCPRPKAGTGSLVTGVFEHAAASSLEVLFEGDGEPLNVTSQHPFWSEDRQDFVPIGEFRIGERARTRDGRVVPLTSVTPRAGPFKVHNLEIHGEHVFHAGNLSLLVHNNSAKAIDHLVTVYHFTDAKGIKAIASGKNITIKALKPNGGNPVGAYFSKVGPDILQTKAAAKLRMSHSKTQFVIEARVPRSILKEKGGFHDKIIYSPVDVNLLEGFWKAYENPFYK